VLFLGFTLFIEIYSTLLADNGQVTVPVYNISTTIEVVYYLWVFREILKKVLQKKILLLAMIGYPVISLIDLLFIQQPGNFHSVSYAIGCLLIILFSIIYFYDLFTNPKAIILHNEPAFWITTGLLLFYSVSFPLFVSTNLMKFFSSVLAKNVDYILIVLNVFLYLLFSIAFLCRIKIKKS
jgi:hypothetical protein